VLIRHINKACLKIEKKAFIARNHAGLPNREKHTNHGGHVVHDCSRHVVHITLDTLCTPSFKEIMLDYQNRRNILITELSLG
jgi:hypothetical protein